MSRHDNCEAQVIAALNKEGWVVIHRQASYLSVEGRYVYIDLKIPKPGQTLLVLEVKCFADSQTIMADFYVALGQYIYYRNVLSYNQAPEELYLSIPQHVYEGILTWPTVQMTLAEVSAKLVIIDLEQEEIISWKTW
jgi:hypothetical protein